MWSGASQRVRDIVPHGGGSGGGARCVKSVAEMEEKAVGYSPSPSNSGIKLSLAVPPS